jgi:predicted RNA-binding protein YlxR (DUF448 family)
MLLRNRRLTRPRETNLPSDAHVPIRTCIGCRQQFPQDELIRCVLDADGTVRVDRRAPGRGAWLCGSRCLEPAIRRKAFDRTWRQPVTAEALEHLVVELAGGEN